MKHNASEKLALLDIEIYEIEREIRSEYDTTSNNYRELEIAWYDLTSQRKALLDEMKGQ